MIHYVLRLILLALISTLILPISSGATDISVMTFNLRYDNNSDGDNQWGLRKHRALAVINEFQPDIVGTQEGLAHMLTYLDKNMPAYARFGKARGGDGADEFNAVYYNKSKFKLLEHKTEWLSDTPAVAGSKSWGNYLPRVLTRGLFECVHGGKRFIFVNTHFDHLSQPSREKSAHFIWNRIQQLRGGLPVVFVGDLNANRNNKAIRFLVGDACIGGATGLFESAYQKEPGLLKKTTWNGFSNNLGADRIIDWIFFTPGTTTKTVEIIYMRVDGRYPSDHFPVMARLQLPPSSKKNAEGKQ
jgi:endonuclease/exonuclease/phosphatase family metal-dependent hydrolase